MYSFLPTMGQEYLVSTKNFERWREERAWKRPQNQWRAADHKFCVKFIPEALTQKLKIRKGEGCWTDSEQSEHAQAGNSCTIIIPPADLMQKRNPPG